MQKLYEFSYTDKQGLTEAEICHAVAELLEHEADTQSWEPDFSFAQNAKPEQLEDGRIRYYFQVSGQFSDEEGSIDSEDGPDQDAHFRGNDQVAAERTI